MSTDVTLRLTAHEAVLLYWLLPVFEGEIEPEGISEEMIEEIMETSDLARESLISLDRKVLDAEGDALAALGIEVSKVPPDTYSVQVAFPPTPVPDDRRLVCSTCGLTLNPTTAEGTSIRCRLTGYAHDGKAVRWSEREQMQDALGGR